MAFELPALKYDFNAREPHVDALTMEIHHDRHHATYVNNLNAAIEKHPELADKTIEGLLADLERDSRRHSWGGAQQRRRTLEPPSIFWTVDGSGGRGTASGRAADLISASFGDLPRRL